MLTRVLAVAFANDNIRVNAICPGPIWTPVWRDMPSRYPEIDFGKRKRETLERLLIKRFGTEEEIAASALYLVSSESSYITGVAFPVDGGRTAM